jgi:hypothetical protein
VSDADGTEDTASYEIQLGPPALRAIAEQLPLSVADAVLMFLKNALGQESTQGRKAAARALRRRDVRSPFDLADPVPH